MLLFLQIVAAIFVSMVLVILFFLFWLKWRMRSAFKELAESVKEMGAALEALKASGGVPARISVVPADADDPPQFEDKAKEDLYVRPLLAAGFTDLGYFVIEEMASVPLRALMNVEQATYAAVFEWPGVGPVLDLTCGYPDGASITYSTSPETGLERPPGRTIVREPGSTDVAGLYARYLRERPPGPFLPVSADAFPRWVEKAHADEQDWRNSRGGASEQEIRRIAAKSGEPVDDFTVQLARHVESVRAMAATEDAVKERFYEQMNWAEEAREAGGENLVVIHEGHGQDHIVEAYLEAADPGVEGDEWDAWHEKAEQEARRLTAGLPARKAFEALNQRLPEGKRFQKLGEVTQPVGADVYESPDPSGTHQDD